ncbi:hypothetical protein ATANTOWER_004298 [Ataeniobius toweri]|uniref:Uncharacterized protein n=1 Tax=Ataeniobius toweri TaxID=208326 RepID=A0ABU7BBR6_9TELE|nr:hypothetical protein [Ataeniobius toweri]
MNHSTDFLRQHFATDFMRHFSFFLYKQKSMLNRNFGEGGPSSETPDSFNFVFCIHTFTQHKQKAAPLLTRWFGIRVMKVRLSRPVCFQRGQWSSVSLHLTLY